MEMRQILEMIKVPEDMIKSIEDTTSIQLVEDKENILKIKLNKDVAYDLYCEEFLDTSDIREVTLLDIVYSEVCEEAYTRAYSFARAHRQRVRHDDYNPESAVCQSALVCYILTRVNEYKYSKLKGIEDVDDEVPFQIYRKLLNKSPRIIEVGVYRDGVLYAGELDEIAIRKSMSGPKVIAFINIISRGSEGYVKGVIGTQIYPKMFVKDLSDLGLVLITDELKAELAEKGKHYVKMTKEPLYCECHGESYTQGWMGDDRHRVDSRVMIDPASFKLLNPRVDNSWYEGSIFSTDNIIGQEVPKESLWMCSPVVYGFSFGNKIWCKMYAKDITEIQFSENAFEELIIPEKNKDLFIASLQYDMPSLDSISDKGAGKIFLLYGAPGVGKTMTAESVAEFLRKPLYYVSVGELGVRPEELEKALDNVMRVANSWDAIILLDEVDVFAVKRDGASIERNAMTAIFLRMLERYSGVMFMTTNLLDNLDDAFISRSTAVIKYNDLTANDREKIWNGLLDKVEKLNTLKVSLELRQDVPEFAEVKLNGRVIKNTVRLAYSLALSKGEDLESKHIRAALELRQC